MRLHNCPMQSLAFCRAELRFGALAAYVHPTLWGLHSPFAAKNVRIFELQSSAAQPVNFIGVIPACNSVSQQTLHHSYTLKPGPTSMSGFFSNAPRKEQGLTGDLRPQSSRSSAADSERSGTPKPMRGGYI